MNLMRIQYARRNKKLVAGGFENYREFLASQTWARIKKKITQRRKSNQEFWTKCYCCGKEKSVLVPHHLKYKHVVKPILSQLVPVCNGCHFLIHEYHRNHPWVSIKTATRRVKSRMGRGCEEPVERRG